MSSDAGLRFEGVSKRYRRRGEGRRSLRALAFARGGRRLAPEFWALRDVSFTVPAGTTTGLVGGNGAGKSTLLRLAAGLSRPSAGTIAVPPDTLSVLGLGASFAGDLTGAENALSSLIVNGLARRRAAALLPAVREFAELEDFFESPVRTYSAGMGLRLAFAVAAQLDARAILVDEVLSVGDLRFQRKCTDHLARLRASGATILIASHDLGQVEETCADAVWLHAGRVRRAGPAGEVVAAYRDAMRSRTMEATPAPGPHGGDGGGGDPGAPGVLELRRNRFGSQELRLEDVRVNGGPEARIEPGAPLRVQARLAAGPEPRRVVLGMSVWHADDGVELVKEHRDLGLVAADLVVSVEVERLDAEPGDYRVDIGAYEAGWEVAYDYHWGAHRLTVVGAPRADAGLLRPPVRWRVDSHRPVSSAQARGSS